jgi:putative tryptophan/tyrosine transport system substrate-binding protein
MQFDRLKRREFITLLSGAVAAWPLAARAEQRAIRVVGYLHTSTPPEYARLAFIQGLSEAGYSEGQNIAIVYRFGESRPERLADLANDLIQRRVEVIVTSGGSLAAQAAKKSTTTTPIVFVMGDADPVQAGIVAGLSRPGGNVTGISLLGGALGPKRVEILREVVPDATVVAVLVNPENQNSAPYANEVEAAIRAAGQRSIILRAASAGEFEHAFALLLEQKAGALIVTADNTFTREAARLTELATRHRVPAIYQWRDFVTAGGLVSYGASIAEANRQAGVYTGRILKGEKPTDLPVVQPTKFELVINLKTANALGLTVPPQLLARADEVIE